MLNANELAAKIIKGSKFMTLATTDNKGGIWATPLSYVFDDECNFYFTTAVDSIHVEHIKENPYVAFAIFNSTVRVSDIDGVQVKGICGEVEKEELNRIVSLYYQHVFPDPDERKDWEAPPEYFTQDDFPVYRFFQISPIEVHKRDTVNIDVDRRVKIDVTQLCELLKI
jgi:uncharacterized protein YhbP (UPF0306 family)